MFTGLIRERGRLIADPKESGLGGVSLRIGHSPALAAELGIGASLAVSGVCLTIVEKEPAASAVELAPETLARSTLGALRNGSAVNLEPALKMGDALGGHWVQGHVDATTEMVSRRDLEQHSEITFVLPAKYRSFFVEKGSVTLDGVSLTIAGLAPETFSVALIPHTLEVTTLGDLGPGMRVNLEVDVLAKYVQRALAVAGTIPE